MGKKLFNPDKSLMILGKVPSLTTLALMLWFAIPANLSGQGYLRAQGKAIVNGDGDTLLLRGMGLGGWMLQEGYMLQTSGFANAQYQIRDKIEQLIGSENTDLFYEKWLKNHVRKIDIDSLKAWGFNSVRLPMHYNLFTLPVEEEPVEGAHTWIQKGFELTDSLISWCSQNQMYVILDLHAAPGGQGYDAGISDYDPSRPSLWESKENRDKTVALWKKIAERYADEPWVAGYDLINEPNWNMSGNTPLRDLYHEITDTIRKVDQHHMLFIEGNWFANDFNGLTPPWDDNLVYSPHKYWSVNNQNSIQWVLNLRDAYQVPLYFGEAGENSNVWFRDAIRLFEEHQIGWAWWPMKKIESIAGPLSVPKTDAYQSLLDFWEGNGTQPGAEAARSALMQMAEGLKLENCIYHKDVIDAMFRQVYSGEAVPYKIQEIPGVVHPTDFDMGVLNSAYYDTDVANYQVSTGTYTSWNNGWMVRNDAVDIEPSQDKINSNGYSIGWISSGEWMQYSVNVATTAIYDVEVRVASTGTEGKFHLQSGSADVSRVMNVPSTGDWQNWQTVTIRDVILSTSDHKIRFFADHSGFNLGSLKFIQKGSTSSMATLFLSAMTLDDHTIQLNLNKPLAGPLPQSPADFQVLVNGAPVSIQSVGLNMENPRMIIFTANTTFRSSDIIQVTYSGSGINALDGTPLQSFNLRPVNNRVAIFHAVPGKVEAEEYYIQSGIQLESTTDIGAGQNISYLDAGDYADYFINVSQAGTYNVTYRTAAQNETGAVKLELMDADGNLTLLHEASFAPTGGWQTWINTKKSLALPEGEQRIRLTIQKPLFNINWLEFTFLGATSVHQADRPSGFMVFPNPSDGFIGIEGSIPERQDLEILVYNLLGQKVFARQLHQVVSFKETLDLEDCPGGQYIVMIRMKDGSLMTQKIMLVKD